MKNKNKKRLDEEALIAHYDTGNVEDPLGLIHEKNGMPILADDENILREAGNIKCSVGRSKEWTSWVGSHCFDDAGIGVLYRTNKRLIYIREPQPGEHFRSGGILGMPRQGVRGLQAKEWKEKGRKECISIPFKTIKRLRTYKISKNILVYASSNNEKYMIFMGPSKLISPIIEGNIV